MERIPGHLFLLPQGGEGGFGRHEVLGFGSYNYNSVERIPGHLLHLPQGWGVGSQSERGLQTHEIQSAVSGRA